MVLAVSTRYFKYEPVVPTTEFEIPFPIYGDEDLEVYVDGELITSGYSVSGKFNNGVSTDASIVLTSSVTDVDVEIFGARTPRREENYLGNSPNLATNLQEDLDRITAVQQEHARELDRTIRAGIGEGFEVEPGDDEQFLQWSGGKLINVDLGNSASGGDAGLVKNILRSHTGDGTTVDFAIGQTVTSAVHVLVNWEGRTVLSSEYALHPTDNSILRFNEAPPDGSSFEIRSHAPISSDISMLSDLGTAGPWDDAEEALKARGACFDTRAEGVTYSQTAFAQILGDGATFTANNRVYQRKMGATDITDMPGWVPFGHVVFPDQFGDGFDGTVNDTAAVRLCFFYANENGLLVSYSGLPYANTEADGWIVVNTHFNIAGCELKAVNGLEDTPASHTVNTMYHVYNADTPLVTGNVATPAADGSLVGDYTAGSTRPTADFCRHAGYAYIQGSGGTGPNISNRYKDGLLSYRQSFAIGVNARTLQPLSVDMTAETEIYYKYRLMPLRGRIEIVGGTVDTDTFNNQEIFRIERNNVRIGNMQFMQKDGDADPDTINRLIKIYSAAYVQIDDVVAHAQQDGGDGGGTYVFNFEDFAEVRMHNCTATEGWGAMGTNNGNGLYVSNCNLNRVDFHNGGHNYFVSDSTVYNRGVYLGWGGGTLQITNCKWIDAPVVNFRTDYGGYFYGNIIVDGVEGSNHSFVWTIVDATTNPVGTEVISAPVARSITVRNITRTDLDSNGDNREIIPVSITVNSGASMIAPIAPSNIHIENITGAGNWRFQCLIDYQNMVLPADTDNCTLNIINAKATRTNFTGLGIQFPTQYAGAAAGVGDYRVQLRVTDSTKMSISVDEHPKVDVYVYDTDINRIVTPDDADVEVDGGTMENPQLIGAETHSVVGGAKSGVGYTSIRNVKVQGIDASSGWDFSNVENMVGVDIPKVTTNDGIIYPSGCDRRQAYLGWMNDVSNGEITNCYLADAQDPVAASPTPVTGFYSISQGIATITINAIYNMDASTVTSADTVRIQLPEVLTAANAASKEQFVNVLTQQLPHIGTYFVKTRANSNYLELYRQQTGDDVSVKWADVSGLGADIRGFTIHMVL
jgi:hypothetical protein